MTRARELADVGAPAGTVVVANYQTEGRGTHGRTWLAPPGTCLMLTLIARPRITPTELADLPLRASESIATMLRDDFGIACEVKPPNDILVNGRKLCGVLCTSHIVGEQVEWVLVGVGLNTRMTEEQLPLETATSLKQEGLVVPTHDELLELVLARLVWIAT